MNLAWIGATWFKQEESNFNFMTTLQKLYQILQNDSKSTIETGYAFKPTRPNKPVSFNPYNIPQTRKNKPLKEQLAKTLAFIDLNKQRRFSDGVTVMPIATTNKRLISIWGSPKSVSRAIQFMISIGLLAEYDESYQFNAYYERDNKCKQYAYSYETEQSIKEYCKDNNINKYQILNTTIVDTFAIKDISFEQSEVRFSSKLHLLKPDNWSCAEFENYLTGCLYVNYPQLKHYQELADKINETYYADDYDRQIRFKPNFTWNKGNKAVTKIGIRATNALVSAKKEQDNDRLCKDDVLNRYGLKYEFDVKSSVPRLTFALNKGVWLDNDIDLYEIMYEKFMKLCPSEQLEWNDETRKIFKSFHMNGYFDTEAKLSAHLKRQVSMKVKYNKEEWQDLDYVMKSYRESIIQTVGELKYDSEVFFHESCIYLDVTNELLSRGYDVWQQYDCWYTDKEVVDVEQIVTSKVNMYVSSSSNNSNSNSNSNNNNNKHNNNNNNNNTTIVDTFVEDDVNTLVDDVLSYYKQDEELQENTEQQNNNNNNNKQ